MAIKLNLLPPELAVDKNLNIIIKTVRSLGIISIASFLIFIVGLVGFFIMSSITLKNLTSDIDVSKNKIIAQEASEQQIILLKDRINKISTIQNLPTSLKNIIAIEPFLANLSPDSLLSELDIDSQKAQLLLNFKSNNDLGTFFRNLSGSEVFKSVVLSSFSLNPATGYSVSINIE